MDDERRLLLTMSKKVSHRMNEKGHIELSEVDAHVQIIGLVSVGPVEVTTVVF